MSSAAALADYPVVSDLQEFDPRSGLPPPSRCAKYNTLMHALEWQLQQLPAVVSTILNAVAARAPRVFFNQDCNVLSVCRYLKDHRADTSVLLAFMFMWNLLGALIPLPALTAFWLRPQVSRRVA